MKRTTLRSTDLARWLVAAIAVVVVSFVASSLLAHHRALAIDDAVSGIVDAAMPGVRDLSAVRGAVHRLDLDAERLADHGQVHAFRVDDDRRALEGAVAAYRALPARTEPRRDRALAAVMAVDSAAATLEDGVARADAPSIEGALREERAAAAHADLALERLIDMHAADGVAYGLKARASRAATARLVLLLDAFSAVVAAIAAALAVALSRRAVGSLEEAQLSAERRASVLAERSSELDRFAGRVAHDVLSPLSAANLALQTVQRRVSDPELQRIVQRGLSALLRTRELVDGLLEFARTGAPSVEGARAPVGEIVEEIVSAARVEAQAAHVALTHAVDEPMEVACRPGVLGSVVSNLVRNAIKYIGDTGDRRVMVRARRVGAACRIEVEDTGPGVPPDLERAIFEPFTRGRTDVPGVGLGLATVQRLAVAHGGRVTYARTAQGTTLFACEIPLAAPRDVAAARPGAGAGSDASRPLVD